MKRDTIVYGAGAMGRAAVKILSNFGIRVLFVVDKNPQLSGKCIGEIPIIIPEEIDISIKCSCDFLVAMSARPYYEIKSYLASLGVLSIYPIGDYIQSINDKIEWANIWRMDKYKYQLLSKNNPDFSDEKSLIDYRIAMEWFYSRDESKWIDDAFIIDRNKYFPDFLIKKIRDRTVMVDTSVMSGEYAEKYLKAVPNGVVYSFVMHPNVMDKKNIDDCGGRLKIEDLELFSFSGKISGTRRGIMEPFIQDKEYSYNVTTIDEYFNEHEYSFLRVYSMSRVHNIIKGAKNTIIKYRPVIAVNIGHYEDDFTNVPLLLKEYCKNYSFYFRVSSFQGNDCIFYCLPNENIHSV